MRRVLVVLGLIVFALSPARRACAQDAINMNFTTIAKPGNGWVSGLDISAGGDRVLFVKCETHDWWSFIPARLTRLLDSFSGCSGKTLVVADERGNTLAKMPFERGYHDAHFVDRNTVAFGRGTGCDIMVATVLPDGEIRLSGERDVPQSGLHANSRLSAAWLDGEVYAAIEHPAGRLAVESLSGDDRHILDGFDVKNVEDVGLAHDIVWFRVAIKRDDLRRYHGPVRIIADYPFPGGGGPGVDEAQGFAAFGSDGDAVGAEIIRNFRSIDGDLPWTEHKRGYSKYSIRDVSPGGTILTTMGERYFYILRREGASYRGLKVDRRPDLAALAVSDNGRVVAVGRDADGRAVVELGVPNSD